MQDGAGGLRFRILVGLPVDENAADPQTILLRVPVYATQFNN